MVRRRYPRAYRADAISACPSTSTPSGVTPPATARRAPDSGPGSWLGERTRRPPAKMGHNHGRHTRHRRGCHLAMAGDCHLMRPRPADMVGDLGRQRGRSCRARTNVMSCRAGYARTGVFGLYPGEDGTIVRCVLIRVPGPNRQRSCGCRRPGAGPRAPRSSGQVVSGVQHEEARRSVGCRRKRV